MKNLFCILFFVLSGCATKSVCMNSNESFRAVYNHERSCTVRIRQVVVGSDLDLPKSLSFKESETQWGYRWVESSFKNGVLELGHFVLVPLGNGVVQ